MTTLPMILHARLTKRFHRLFKKECKLYRASQDGRRTKENRAKYREQHEALSSTLWPLAIEIDQYWIDVRGELLG